MGLSRCVITKILSIIASIHTKRNEIKGETPSAVQTIHTQHLLHGTQKRTLFLTSDGKRT